MKAGHARWALGAVFVLFAVGLSGCLNGGAPISTDPTVTTTMEDPWEDGEAERVLWEGTVEAGEYYPTAAVIELVYLGYVMGGCAAIPEVDVEPILSGSASLCMEADATEALR